MKKEKERERWREEIYANAKNRIGKKGIGLGYGKGFSL
jgi:hypothetical protein